VLSPALHSARPATLDTSQTAMASPVALPVPWATSLANRAKTSASPAPREHSRRRPPRTGAPNVPSASSRRPPAPASVCPARQVPSQMQPARRHACVARPARTPRAQQQTPASPVWSALRGPSASSPGRQSVCSVPPVNTPTRHARSPAKTVLWGRTARQKAARGVCRANRASQQPLLAATTSARVTSRCYWTATSRQQRVQCQLLAEGGCKISRSNEQLCCSRNSSSTSSARSPKVGAGCIRTHSSSRSSSSSSGSSMPWEVWWLPVCGCPRHNLSHAALYYMRNEYCKGCEALLAPPPLSEGPAHGLRDMGSCFDAAAVMAEDWITADCFRQGCRVTEMTL